MTNRFTPTEQKILDVLADGLSHRKEELHACLPDELSAMAAIRPHLSAIRKKLRPNGQDIICETTRMGVCYRWMRMLSDATLGQEL